jgi:hypothetical protein
MAGRRAALATLATGLLVIAAAQVLAPIGAPPLYDGVVPLEPYLWADPPPDHPGGAQGASAMIAVKKGQNALVAVATPEMVPQAQVFAVPGALTLPPGATSIKVSITPRAPSATPSTGYIDGNAYRILLTDQTGAPITADPAQRVSVVLRSADPALAEATIALFDGTAWQPLTTSPPDMPGGGFVAVVTEFGDFAVIASGVSPYPTASASDEASSSPRPSSPSTAEAASPATAAPGGAPTSGGGPPTDVPWLPLGAAGIAAVTLVTLRMVIRRSRRHQPYRGARPGRLR